MGGLQRVLQNLLGERVSIRDLPTILEAIGRPAASPGTSRPSPSMSAPGWPARSAASTNEAGFIPLITLSPDWEQAFAESIVGEGDDRQLAMAPSELQRFVRELQDALEAHAMRGELPALVTTPGIRPSSARWSSACGRRPPCCPTTRSIPRPASAPWARSDLSLGRALCGRTSASCCPGPSTFGEARMRPMALAGSTLFLGLTAAPAIAVPVDLELVLAVDISGSMDTDEQALQRRGYIEAFLHAEVAAAVRGGPYGRIAAAYVEWAGPGAQRVTVPWTLIETAADAEDFAAGLAEAPRARFRGTSISGALAFAAPLFENNGYEGLRRVIDVSGDGPNNAGAPVTPRETQSSAPASSSTACRSRSRRSRLDWAAEISPPTIATASLAALAPLSSRSPRRHSCSRRSGASWCWRSRGCRAVVFRQPSRGSRPGLSGRRAAAADLGA